MSILFLVQHFSNAFLLNVIKNIMSEVVSCVDTTLNMFFFFKNDTRFNVIKVFVFTKNRVDEKVVNEHILRLRTLVLNSYINVICSQLSEL